MFQQSIEYHILTDVYNRSQWIKLNHFTPECKNQKHKDTEVKSVADVSQEEKCPLGQKISSSSCSPINIGVSVANKPENDMIVHNETNATLVRTNEAPMKNDPDSSAISAN